MPWSTLSNGINVIKHEVINGIDTPVYEFTRAANVEVAAFTGVAVQGLQTAIETLYDRTGDATDVKAGIVKVTSTLAEDPSSGALTAASIGALKTVSDAVTGITSDYMKKADYNVGSATTVGENAAIGLATLGTDGKVPSAQLPSYVDDVIEGTATSTPNYTAVTSQEIAAMPSPVDPYAEGWFTENDGSYTATTDRTVQDGTTYYKKGYTHTFTPTNSGDSATDTGKIYVDTTTGKTYRYSGSTWVEISESLALGLTSSTAFAGDRGLALEAWRTSMTTGTGNVTKPTGTNGVIAVNGNQITVYEINKTEITTALGAATSSNDGYMTKEQAAQLAYCYEVYFYNSGSTAPTPQGANAIMFEIVSTDS